MFCEKIGKIFFWVICVKKVGKSCTTSPFKDNWQKRIVRCVKKWWLLDKYQPLKRQKKSNLSQNPLWLETEHEYLLINYTRNDVIYLDKTDSKIWIWIERNNLFKAVYSSLVGCLTIYNECDEILIRIKPVTPDQMKTIESVFSKKGAKRIDHCNKPFTYIDTK